MVRKCIYCKGEISEESVIDFCSRCGVGVWGEKMFNTIVQNMKAARERGDINHRGLFIGEDEGKELKRFS